MAPHGGRIEPYTTELAEAIAGEDFSFYSFIGRQAKNNRRELHVASHLYDEELAEEMIAGAELVFAVHGHRCEESEFLMPGGRHVPLRIRLKAALQGCGFDVREPEAGLAGEDPQNICNRGTLGRGLQIEVSKALRDRLRFDDERRVSFTRGCRMLLFEFETAGIHGASASGRVEMEPNR
jgi:phage replication-related protein YjqB (UPF0714/DUF867 family)